MAEFRVVKQLRDPHTLEVKEVVQHIGRGSGKFNEDDQTHVVKVSRPYPPGTALVGTVDEKGFFTPDS